jgi:hypothetical protein
VVAVTGLAGHAFGSWRSRETHKMWLKDFLPKDVKNVRIMTYGYDSRLVELKKSEPRLTDYRRNFIQQLENSRSSAKVCRCLCGARSCTLTLAMLIVSGSTYHIPGTQPGWHFDTASKS